MADSTPAKNKSKCAPCVVKPDGINNDPEKNCSSEEPCQCSDEGARPPPKKTDKMHKKKCCKKSGPFGRDPIQRIDVKICLPVEPPHPCDPPPYCDPAVKPLLCPKPVLCLERLKNPALKTENTRCLPGASINCKRCTIVEPPHPCDPLPICDPDRPKRDCDIPSLCEDRIKNRVWPDGLKIVEKCIPPVIKEKREVARVIMRYTPCEEIIVDPNADADKLKAKPPKTKIIHTPCEENVEVPDLPEPVKKQ